MKKKKERKTWQHLERFGCVPFSWSRAWFEKTLISIRNLFAVHHNILYCWPFTTYFLAKFQKTRESLSATDTRDIIIRITLSYEFDMSRSAEHTMTWCTRNNSDSISNARFIPLSTSLKRSSSACPTIIYYILSIINVRSENHSRGTLKRCARLRRIILCSSLHSKRFR